LNEKDNPINSERYMISESEISPQVKGIIGELIAREYLRKNGYLVWLLSTKPTGNLIRHLHYFKSYGGSGEEHYHIDRVLTPEESAFLLRTRIFDLIAVPKSQLTLEKSEMMRVLIDVKTRFGGGAHGWTPKQIHKSRYLTDLETAKAHGFQVKTLHLDLDLKSEISLSDLNFSVNTEKEDRMPHR
jgi:hypothetical protein